MPMSPMQTPTVGTLLARTISSIRRLSVGWFAIVAIFTMSASKPASRLCRAARSGGVLWKSWWLTIRFVDPYRGTFAAMSSSRSTYSAPSTIAVRSTSSRSSSEPSHLPPSTTRRQVTITGQGRSWRSRFACTLPWM